MTSNYGENEDKGKAAAILHLVGGAGGADETTSDLETGITRCEKVKTVIRERQNEILEALLGTELFKRYSVTFLAMYPILFVLFMVVYASCLPHLLQESYKWQVWAPNAYLGALGLVLCFFGNDIRVRVMIRYMSLLFYLGIYHQVFYIYDNLVHFPQVFRIVVEDIGAISDKFNTEEFWVVVGIIVAVFFVVFTFVIGGAAIFIGIPVIMLIFIVMSFVFLLMLILCFSLYMYQVSIFLICPYWTVYDTYHSTKKVARILGFI